jgi:hypothetical protein
MRKKGACLCEEQKEYFCSIISSLKGLATGMCLPHQHIVINTIFGFMMVSNVNGGVRVLMRETCDFRGAK